MKLGKKTISLALSATMAVACCSCGQNTANALTVNGEPIRAGIYIYYAYSAYYEAMNYLYNVGIAVDDKEVTKTAVIDGVSAREWIQNKATESCVKHVAVLEKSKELGITLDAEEQAELDASVENAWANYEDKFVENGIGKQSIYDTYEVSYLENDIYQYYYGNDAEMGVTEDELYEVYVNNHARVRYIKINLVDGGGNVLKADGKSTMMDMTKDFEKRLKKCKDEEAIAKEMNAIEEEYKSYCTSVSDAYVATSTNENGETQGTTTTTTTAEIVETDDEGNTVTTTTTTADPKEKEVVIARLTTTTTTAPAPVIYMNGTEGTTTTTEPTYSPSKKVYEAIFDGEDAKYLTPSIIEEDEAYYLLVQFDINDRMTEEDLWSESQMESVRNSLYNAPFEGMVDEWAKNYTSERNEKAYKRYDPFEINF